MLISLHKQATTTPKVRAAIQASPEPAWMVAELMRDGEAVPIDAAQRSEFRLGDAAIIKDGHIIIRGSYIVRQGWGTSQIRGALVNVN